MFKDIPQAVLKNKYNYLSGLWNSAFPYFFSLIIKKNPGKYILIFENEKAAESFRNDLAFFHPEGKNIIYYPDLSLYPYEKNQPVKKNVFDRLTALFQLMNSNEYIFLTTTRNLFLYTISPLLFRNNIRHLSQGQKIDLNGFISHLSSSGYQKNYKVFLPGEFNIKGEIIDLFSPQYEHPQRIYLFDDEIEEIKFFNTETQTSFQSIPEIDVIPTREVILDDSAVNTFQERIKAYKEKNREKKANSAEIWSDVIIEDKVWDELNEKIENRIYFHDIYNFLPLLQEKRFTLLDWISPETVLFLPSPDSLIANYRALYLDHHEFYKKKLHHDYFIPEPEQFLIPSQAIMDKLEHYKTVFHQTLPFHQEGEVHLAIEKTPRFYGHIRKFNDFLSENPDYQVFFLAADEEKKEHMIKLFSSEKICCPVNFLTGTIDQGFISKDLKVIFLQDFEFLGRNSLPAVSGQKSRQVLAQGIDSVFDLEENDYVVHVNNGIGLYKGIRQITTDGQVRDYFVIEYANHINLFLPMEKINLLHKYIGDDDNPPPLSRLGSDEFKKAKSKVESSIIEITKDLIKTYALRNKTKGHSYAADTEWQKKFESGFPYIETPDQLRAIKEIKDDMESNKQMDRLLCGDVGYGKTEIAMRAAFKAVMEGKQTAILVPTTILAQQHYNTFSARLKNYPLKVEMLSRFKNRREQKTIIKQLNEGKVDIIIGTHRLISPDIHFKDLGLIIIDEEQRFGVLHKEKLKITRTIVDVLTMSATPIPRTLYMSLSGIRDISLIETPPEGRQPIETRVEKFSDDIIKEAIQSELDRNGQVFFIHNRIDTITAIAGFIQQNIPYAKIGIIHGRMETDELEMVMLDFIEGNLNILVSTTIIESGIDLPHVNTIIINRADAFGLAQLYQLRGRVGRSSQKAYAYLLYPGDKAITETAQKRLLTIYEYSELGAGYKIALRDLEIRGAGNIFGPQQYGNILAVGLELYSKILNTAIKNMKGELPPEEIEPDLDFPYHAYIPADTEFADKIKIEIYKELNKCNELSELAMVRKDLADRYPNTFISRLDSLFLIQEIKILLKKLKILSLKRIEEKKYEYIFAMEPCDPSDQFLKKIKTQWDIVKIIGGQIIFPVDKESFMENIKKKLLLLI